MTDSKIVKILGIETSCDDTGAAVMTFDGGNLHAVSNIVASQVPIHQLTGGVVPEVAAREHVTIITPVIERALAEASISLNAVDAIAVTAGPGLLPALMVGVDTANALSFSSGKPVIPIQHITGHIYANFIDRVNINEVQFPLLALIVSGGHTEFILMNDHLRFEKIGATLDDAAGEAFDKTAKILGLPYPGGPAISKEAENGNPSAYDFPRPMLDSKDLNFSFSGLKTAVLYQVQKISEESLGAERSNLAASIQQAIVDTLIEKTKIALEKYDVKSFTLGGGVSANKLLRDQMKNVFEKSSGINYYEPQVKFSTDNAAMISAVGAMKMHLGQIDAKIVKVNPRWEISTYNTPARTGG